MLLHNKKIEVLGGEFAKCGIMEQLHNNEMFYLWPLKQATTAV